MRSDDTNSLRHLPRRSSKNCDTQFDNFDRFKENYSIDDTATRISAVIVEQHRPVGPATSAPGGALRDK